MVYIRADIPMLNPTKDRKDSTNKSSRNNQTKERRSQLKSWEVKIWKVREEKNQTQTVIKRRKNQGQKRTDETRTAGNSHQ